MRNRYYILTADKLQRTAPWLEKLEGGIEHLREVIIDDKLGICEELERRMSFLVDTYECEWKAVVDDPERVKTFEQFVNTKDTEPGIQFITERNQRRPADWPGLGADGTLPGALSCRPPLTPRFVQPLGNPSM